MQHGMLLQGNAAFTISIPTQQAAAPAVSPVALAGAPQQAMETVSLSPSATVPADTARLQSLAQSLTTSMKPTERPTPMETVSLSPSATVPADTARLQSLAQSLTASMKPTERPTPKCPSAADAVAEAQELANQIEALTGPKNKAKRKRLRDRMVKVATSHFAPPFLF